MIKIRCTATIVLFTISIIACKKYPPQNLTASPPPTGKKWVVTTVAGNGSPFFADGPVLEAQFRAPQDVTLTPNKIIYVADGFNHRFRKIIGSQVFRWLQNGITGRLINQVY